MYLQISKLGLAHRRLSIIDLTSSGHQPMADPSGTLQIVFNGEIYNHLDLRRALEQKGYSYRSHSDTETVLHLFREYGIEALKQLRGMFALAIWDENRRELTLARDRIGIKPLYYTIQNGILIFASEIKAILAHPLVSPSTRSRGTLSLLDLSGCSGAADNVCRNQEVAGRLLDAQSTAMARSPILVGGMRFAISRHSMAMSNHLPKGYSLTFAMPSNRT